ncbi:MAG: hypothetical protein EOO18_05235, partial [Chryseobacterium sp.]
MKIKTLIAVLTLFTFSFGAASCSKDDDKMPTENNGDGNINPSTTKMKITIGTAVFTATLYDNPSANAFKANLPLTINMTELNGNEKYYDLPNPLPTNASAVGDVKVGDLMLYGNNVLVLFYKNLNTTYNYTKLGYVDNPAELASALGAGNIT